MNIASNSIYSKIDGLFRANNDDLNVIINRLKAIGRGAIPPSADHASVRAAVTHRYTADSYQDVYDNLKKAKSVTTAVVKAGQTAYTALVDMQRLATLYPDLTQDTDRQDTDALFKTQAGVVENLKETPTEDGRYVFRAGTILRVTVSPPSNTLEITFNPGDIPNVNDFNLWGADAEDLADVNAELTKLHSFLGKAYSYDSQISGHLAITDAIINTARDNFSRITDTSAKDFAAMTSIQVRQQNLAALMSQANMDQSSTYRLYDMR